MLSRCRTSNVIDDQEAHCGPAWCGVVSSGEAFAKGPTPPLIT